MNIKDYITPLLRWWWLLLVATLLAVVSSFLATFRQPEVYQAHATLMVGQMINNPNPNSNEFYLAQQLAGTYANIGNREQVRNATMNSLGITWMPEYLVQAMPNSPLIEVQVSDTSPQVAQAVANALATQIVLLGPSSAQPGGTDHQAFIEQQLSTLQTQITDTQAQIDQLQQQLGELNSARQITDMQTQIAAEQSKLSSLQANYASLLASTSSGAMNTLTIIEQAELPVTPNGPSKLIIVALAGAVALVLAALGAYLIEALDDSLKTQEEVEAQFNEPVLGMIGKIPKDSAMDYVASEPRSVIADEFRMLRTNLEFFNIDKSRKTILVTGLGISEGKSTIAANLAISLAQNDKRVILVDADFRRPNLHTAVGVANAQGLSDIWLGSVGMAEVLVPWNNSRVYFLPSGGTPPNPTELLDSIRMKKILERIKEAADFVVIDGPPLTVPDSVVLASKVDGVLLVIQLGRTRKRMVSVAKDRFQQSGAKVLGIVLNRVPQHDSYYPAAYYKVKQS